MPLRRDFDIAAFGVNAIYQAKAGRARDREARRDLAVRGRPRGALRGLQGRLHVHVEGDEIDAPAGTAVFVRDPAATRSSVATEDGTIVLAVGGKRGEAYRVSPYDAQAGFDQAYIGQDYERALAILRGALEEYPGNAGITYNVACMEALLGRPDEALAHLAHAIDGWPRAKELAAEDDDFVSLRDNPEFEKLVAN